MLRMHFPPMDVWQTNMTEPDQALKVLEEAAELVEAVKNGTVQDQQMEAMDVIQAVANLCYISDWTMLDMNAAYCKVRNGNKARGRY